MGATSKRGSNPAPAAPTIPRDGAGDRDTGVTRRGGVPILGALEPAAPASSLSAVDALGDVLITGELGTRPSRPPDYEAEAKTLSELARGLGVSPGGLLQKVAEAAMALCRADSSGVSILEPGGEHGILRWHAVAGAFAANLNGTMPREASPCGEVMCRNVVLLFERAERHFPALRGVNPPIYESLLAPWKIEGAPAGTLWVLGHTPDRHFDAEDARLLASLAGFAAAWQASQTAIERNVLRRQLTSAEEEERRRLARELHDQLGQHLTGLALGLADARGCAGPESPAQPRLAQLEELARTMSRDVRYLALELRPPELDDLGLESALETYVEQWAARYGIAAEVAVSGLPERTVPAEVSTTLYRLLQEALTNVARHAAAREVSVVVERRDGAVRLIVEDDGRGFEVELTRRRARSEGRLGLAGMRERAMLIGGTLTIESSPGAGTTLYAQVPVDHAPAAADARATRSQAP